MKTPAKKAPVDNTPEEDEALVDSCVARLAEHFDTVRIFVTRDKPHTTRSVSRGGGNFYTSLGQIHEWCIRQDELTRQEVRNDE